jgi:predicted nucleic acid-binding Zn ribbon protein
VSGDARDDVVSGDARDDVPRDLPDVDEDAAPVRPLSGVDLARATLAKAREEARARGKAVARRRRAGTAQPARRRDPGDPQPLGETLAQLLAERGWDVPTAVAGVTERWPEVAGDDLAAHCRPQRFDAGVLMLVAESTAWATQVRLLVPQLHRRLDDVLGRGIVTRIEVHGPVGPDWRKGPLRVRGVGPRDTYG